MARHKYPKQVSFYTTYEMNENLKKISKETKRSKNEIIRDSINAYILRNYDVMSKEPF